jgi:hypothetical protein
VTILNVKDIQEIIKKSLLNVGLKIYRIFAIYVGIIFVINIFIIMLYRPIWQYMNSVYVFINKGNYNIPDVSGSIYISMLFIFVMILLSRLVTLGWVAACLNISRGSKEISFHDLSSMFPRFWKITVIYIIETVLIQIGLFFFILPGLILMLKWSMAFYVLIEHPEYGPVKCLKQSSRLMVGEIKNLLRLGFSFFTQYFIAGMLSYVSSGIISLWKVPPLAIGYAAFYNKLVYWKPETKPDEN